MCCLFRCFKIQLCIQRTHLQLKEFIIDNLSKTQPSCIFGLDVQSVFDNVTHAAILNRLRTLNCGSLVQLCAYGSYRWHHHPSLGSPCLWQVHHTSEMYPPRLGDLTYVVHHRSIGVTSPTQFHRGLFPRTGRGLYNTMDHQRVLWPPAGLSPRAIDSTLAYLYLCGPTGAPSKSSPLNRRSRSQGRPVIPTPYLLGTTKLQSLHQCRNPKAREFSTIMVEVGQQCFLRFNGLDQLTLLIQRVCSRRRGLK